jgi:TonB-dependent receptor
MSIGNSSARSKLACACVAMMLIMTQSLFAAGSGTVKGKVLDKATGEPLIGANIVVLNTSLGGSANFDGLVNIYGVPLGQQTLKISYIGYEPITVQATIIENGVFEQEFRLSPQAIEGEEVVITAQARGQNEAINQQIAAKSMVNVVSADKMKELPDANIAESIGRLPGVSLQRDAGEANAVVVRGLSPRYNAVSIEGVPMVSTNFADRGIDLSLLADDLVKGVEVSKTLRPDMDADALGGTVNLTLKTALEGMHFDLRGYGGYTELDKSYKNYKFAGTVGDRFFDNKFGVLLQGSIEEKRLPTQQFNGSYAQPQGAKLANGDTVNNLSTFRGTLIETSLKRNRYSGSVILDYASDIVDVKFYTTYEQRKDSTLTRSNQETFLNSQYLYQIFANITKTEQRTHSLQFLFKLGKTELPISLSYTRGDMRSPNAQQIDIYGYQGDPNYQPLKVTQTNFVQPSVLMNYMGPQKPEYSLLQQPNIINTSLTDQSYDVKADWKVPFKMSDKLSGVLSVGGKYHSIERNSNREKKGLYIQYGQGKGARLDLIAYLTATYPGFSTDPSLQTGILAHNFTDPNYTGGKILGYAIGPQYNVSQLMDINKYFWTHHGPGSLDANGNPADEYLLDGVNSYNQDYTDKENTAAGYIMGEFNIGSDLTIIPGIRFQEEKTDISAYHVLVDGISPTGLTGYPILYNSKRDNPNWFPSVNIKYKATENIQILGAVYRSITLPSFIEISPATIFNPGGVFLPNGDRIQISSGNPLLKPATAMNFDLGVSVFNNNIGLFTVNVFYKEISDLIYSMQNYQPFLTSPVVGGPADLKDRLPAAAYFDTSFAKLTTGLLSTNIPMNNPEKAYLRGIELSWQTHMWYLPWVFSGIVLDFNASFMSSNQLYPYFKTVRTGGTLIRPIYSMVYNTKAGQLQDQPKAIYNAILGWDYEGFSSRFSFRYQQTTLTSLDTRYSLRDAYYDNVLLVDISVKQQILDNLAIFASVTNVNSHIDNYYLNYYNGNNGTSGRLPTSEQAYGMNAQLGLSYSY